MLQSFAFTLPLLFALPALASQLSNSPFGDGIDRGNLIYAFMPGDGEDILGPNGEFQYLRRPSPGQDQRVANDGDVFVRDNKLILATEIIDPFQTIQDETKLGIRTKKLFEVAAGKTKFEFVVSSKIFTDRQTKAAIEAAEVTNDADVVGYECGVCTEDEREFFGFVVNPGKVIFIRHIRKMTTNSTVEAGVKQLWEVVTEVPVILDRKLVSIDGESTTNFSAFEVPNSGLGIDVALGIIVDTQAGTVSFTVDGVIKDVNRLSGITGNGQFIRQIYNYTMPLLQSGNPSKSSLVPNTFLAKQGPGILDLEDSPESIPTKFAIALLMQSRNRQLGCIPERVTGDEIETFRCRDRPTPPVTFVGLQDPESPVNPEVGGDSSAQPATGDQKTTLNNLVAVKESKSLLQAIFVIIAIIIKTSGVGPLA